MALRFEKAFFIDSGVPLHSSSPPPRLLDLKVGVFLTLKCEGAIQQPHSCCRKQPVGGVLLSFICLFVKKRSESGEERDRQQRWRMRQEGVDGTELLLCVKAETTVATLHKVTFD